MKIQTPERLKSMMFKEGEQNVCKEDMQVGKYPSPLAGICALESHGDCRKHSICKYPGKQKT